STTVINLNVLDTSKTNDTGGTEWISFQEVANALFPTTNAQQTLTVDSSFWLNCLQLTFCASGQWYTIWGTTDGSGHHQVHIGTSDSYGKNIAEFSGTYDATLGSPSGLVNWAYGATGHALFGTSWLTAAEIEGSSAKDVIQGINNNT